MEAYNLGVWVGWGLIWLPQCHSYFGIGFDVIDYSLEVYGVGVCVWWVGGLLQ